jgi:hypothetical protein
MAMSTSAKGLSSLLGVRTAEERRAEVTLNAALGARARAEAEDVRLVAAVESARDSASGRGSPPTSRRAPGPSRRSGGPSSSPRAAPRSPRAPLTCARGRREVVERALARREAVRRLELERRAEPAADDRRHGGSREES